MYLITEDKNKLRQEISLCQNALDESYLRMSDRDIFAMMTVLPEYRAASVLFCFVSVDKEPNTHKLIEHALTLGKRVGVPLCIGKGVMEVREITSWEDLEPGLYGILAPKENCLVLAPETIELAVIPCVTCNRKGMRLGHGGGYYDRYMEKLTCPSICLCRGELLREEIPVEVHDRPVNAVVTEQGIYR